jgi:predicted TPR repeat methyltransferase
MTAQDTSGPDFFESKYQLKADFWDFATKPTELLRYEKIMAALSHQRYQRAFEPGCSIGVLSERLATISDLVECFDFSPTAVAQARERCASLTNVKVTCNSLREAMPIRGFDLIVLSDIGYYFSPREWNELATDLIAPMTSGAILLAAHWLGASADHQMSGDEVHEALRSSPLLRLEHSHRYETFRLDRWVRT